MKCNPKSRPITRAMPMAPSSNLQSIAMCTCIVPGPISVQARSHAGGGPALRLSSVPQFLRPRRRSRAGCGRNSAQPRNPSVHAYSADSKTHLDRQASFFSSRVQDLRDGITPEIDARLHTIAGAVPGLGPESRVLDAGCGAGALIPHLQALGVQDILAVDACPAMLSEVEARFGAGESLGNVPCVRTWPGDVAELPLYQVRARWTDRQGFPGWEPADHVVPRTVSSRSTPVPVLVAGSVLCHLLQCRLRECVRSARGLAASDTAAPTWRPCMRQPSPGPCLAPRVQVPG